MNNAVVCVWKRGIPPEIAVNDRKNDDKAVGWRVACFQANPIGVFYFIAVYHLSKVDTPII